MTFITKLNAGTVVDRAGLNKLKTEEMATTLAELYKDPAVTVLIVDNVQQFFSVKNLMAALDDNSPALPMLLEQKGITLTEEDIDTVRQFSEVKQHILDTIEANKPAPPPYPFADVPNGWSLENNIVFLTKHIRRKTGNTDYKATPGVLKKVWEIAGPHWASGSDRSKVAPYLSFNGYNREARIHPTHIDIGCQTIKRYELEQVAVHLGWDLPEVSAED